MKNLATKSTVVVINGRKFLCMLGAFLVLAATIGWAIAAEHQHASDARNDLKAQTYQVLVQGCNSGNTLRTTLEGLIDSPASKAFDEQLVKEGRLTQSDLDKAEQIADTEKAAIAPRSCKNAYAALKP